MRIKILFLVVSLFVSSISLLSQNVNESWKVFDDTEVGRIDITVPWAAINYMYANVQSDSIHLASVNFKNAQIDEMIDSVGIRLRGNTSRESQKKSFKVSINSFFSGRKFYGLEKLNLNGEHNDPSISRSKLCWDFFNDVSVTASRAAHTQLYINEVYYGLYVLVEHIDENFLKMNYADDTGNLWKCLFGADLTYRGADPANYIMDPYELKTNEEENDFSLLAELCDIINNTPDNFFADSLESILVVPEVLKYFAMNILTGSWDDYWSLSNNYYIYHEPAINKFHWIPYDYDNTLGIDFFSIDWANVNPYQFPKVVDGPRPLAERLMNNAQYRNLYTHFIEFYRDNVLDLLISASRIDDLKSLITPAAEADTFRTLDYGFTASDFNNSFSLEPFNVFPAAYGIKQFISERTLSVSSMLNYQTAAPNIYAIDWYPKTPMPNDTIHVYASVFANNGLDQVRVQYSINNSALEYSSMNFEPVADTKIVEESDLWHGKIPPVGEGGTVSFKVLANGTNMLSQLSPRGEHINLQAPHAITDSIVVNELMALNSSTVLDDNGDYDDWVELYNPTNSVIELSGKYLSDKPDNLTKWGFPQGTSIQPNEFLIIWCDEDSSITDLHTNFKLSGNGEFISITAEDGITVIDSFSFGPQTDDISFGKFPDGTNTLQFLSPTPGNSNILTDAQEKNNLIAHNFALEQNYPNPFNPSTRIFYQIPKAGKTSLIIYDVLGNKVADLVDSYQSAGKYEYTLNINSGNSRLSSGVYFYKLTSGNFTAVKKLILLK